MVPKRTRGARLLCIAVSSVAVAADASRAQTALLQLEEPATEKDDPAARRAAMREWRGEQAADTRWRILQEAIKERDRWSIGVPPVPAPRAALAVQGTAFVNLGPTRADFEFNGAQYIEIDSGRVRQILVDPVDANVLYLASSGGGVWKTHDGGGGWEPITDGLGTLSVGTLAMDPASGEVLYLGFGDPFDVQLPGLVKSLDGGAHWTDPVQLTATYSLSGTTYSLVAGSVTDIKVDPGNSLVVLAATDQGLFRSTDAGATFQHVALTGATPADVYYHLWSIAFVGPNTWLASGQRRDLTRKTAFNDLGLFRSVDDGASWSFIGDAIPGGVAEAARIGRVTIAAAPGTTGDVATSRVYLLAGNKAGDAQYDVFRSDDGGRSFLSLQVNSSAAPTNPNPDQPDLNVMHAQAFYNQAIAVDPQNPDVVFVGGDLAMVRSSDAGRSWSVLSDWLPAATGVSRPYVHADFHAFAMGVDGAFYAGTDGGIFRSPSARTGAPEAVTFTSARNEGLVNHLVYSVVCAPETWPAAQQGFVAGGLQDNGTRARSGGTTTFNQIMGGDGIGLAVSASATISGPAVFLVSTAGNLFSSVDGGRTFRRFVGGLANPPPFFVRLGHEPPAGADTFLTFDAPGAGPPSVYRSDGLTNWRAIPGQLHWQNPATVTDGFVAPSGTQIGLRNIATHPGAPNGGVWGLISNKFAYVTIDAGANWLVSVQPTPAGATGGVLLLSSFAFDPSDLTGRTYYVTTKTMLLDDLSPLPASFGHLYKTADGGATWQSLGVQPANQGGLPFVPFDVLKVDPGDPKTLYLGTEVGLYRSQDGGLTWTRFGAGSLPLVEVTDFCISPASKRLTASTFGRGFWEISTDASADPAGVRGNGDTNFDFRIDGQDLIDLADSWGSTEASATYRWQADLTGAVNKVDDADLTALLSKFGGPP